ncbi:MAG: VCBS repeat-containing protein [Bacteroidia bacterium]|nr:VCBS repeat-containing protein [Bacteroidia bacterium]
MPLVSLSFVRSVFRACLAGWILWLAGCQSAQQAPPPGQTLFTTMPATYTGIDFVNSLTFDEEFNIYTYRNFYNGGGVGMGDINNDGLMDLYFCGNMKPSRLYLNKGNFQFEDITARAGVACEGSWATGVSFADVNADGLLDLYVCKAGKPEGRRRFNELFINNGDLTFTEQSEKYGLNDKGFSTHAAFFDYDKDGDLDCYLLNNSFRPIGGFDLRRNQRSERDSLGGNKLYRNEGGRFVDVSEQAGIYGSIIGFGLGVTVGDVNRDGWQDIYVSNDFFERDYLYINNQDGTFSESLETAIRELSAASMGADMADLNNDGYPEIFVTDMLPDGDARLKTKTTFENWDKYELNLRTGYYHQFTRNVLQLNRGPAANGKDLMFSEIGRMAGVYSTDWSWGALMADFDQDGYKDIFVANGIYQDLTDQDFLNFAADPRFVQSVVKRTGVDYKKLIEVIPSVKLPNYAFRNNGDLTFTNQAAAWGLAEPGFSNGSAYGDLDNDGDLDLVTNNCNMPPFVYRNEATSQHQDRHYLAFELTGRDQNTFAIGTEITAYHQGQVFYVEHMPMRGFQATVDYRPRIGLGAHTQVDSLVVWWPDLTRTTLTDVPADQVLKLSMKDGVADSAATRPVTNGKPLFTSVIGESGIDFRHRENDFQDFNRDRLIYHMLSAEGPCMAVADVNGDGREDFFVGNAKNAESALYFQLPNGRFQRSADPVLAQDSVSEDTDCVFFDADNDGDLDLYVASGGNEFSSFSDALADRLYLNNGNGRFTKSPQRLPGSLESTACVAAADYDRDGDQDLFVGVRLKPFEYGMPVRGYILTNNGRGQFTDATAQVAPALMQTGMFTDALWTDIDRDGDPDLVTAGEYMPIQVWVNTGGKLTESGESMGLGQSHGFWNTLVADDIDGDGDTDLIGGNHGLNSRFKADGLHPVCMHVNDFDQNNSIEQIVCVFSGENSFPLALRHDLVMQMPILKRKYLKYETYQEQTIEDIFTPEQRKGMITHYAYEMRTTVWLNQGGKFEAVHLPTMAQIAPVYAIIPTDVDQDGHKDLLIGGNFWRAKPEVGGYNSSYGLYLRGDGKGHFNPVPMQQSGLAIIGEVRRMALIKRGGKPAVLVARNNDRMELLTY